MTKNLALAAKFTSQNLMPGPKIDPPQKLNAQTCTSVPIVTRASPPSPSLRKPVDESALDSQ